MSCIIIHVRGPISKTEPTKDIHFVFNVMVYLKVTLLVTIVLCQVLET